MTLSGPEEMFLLHELLIHGILGRYNEHFNLCSGSVGVEPTLQ